MKSALYRLFWLPALAAAATLSAQAAFVYVDEDFDWYRSEWTFNNTSENPDRVQLSQQDPDGSINRSLYVQSTGNATFGDQIMPFWVTPTNEEPVVFKFRFFDPMTTNLETGTLLDGRMFGVIRPRTGDGFVAIGLNNAVNTGTYDLTRYQARVIGGGEWIQLATERTYGWQEFEAVIHHDSVDIYVNGQLDPNGFNRPRAATVPFQIVQMGGGLSSNTEGWFDDVWVAKDASAARVIEISEQPAPLTLAVGDQAVFSVVTTGSGPLNYQWEKDTTPLSDGGRISGATAASLTIGDVQLDDAGYYGVALTFGPVTEHAAPAQLTVHPFFFTLQPKSQFLQFGDAATFTVELHGEGPFSYQWQKEGEDIEDGDRISGIDTYTLTIASVQASDEGIFRVVVTNAHGTRNSSTVALSAGPPPTGVRFADFEQVSNGATYVIFQAPRYSGTTASHLEFPPNVSRVVSTFPAGTWGHRVFHTNFKFLPDRTNPWVRLTTHNVTNLGNPIIAINQYLRFEVYSDQDIYLTLGIRETNTTGEIGSNGGTIGGIEWVGGGVDAASIPPKGYLVSAGRWQTVAFDLPNEFVRAYAGSTANGILESTTGKAVLEHIAILPVITDGTYALEQNVYFDNFEVTTVAPPPSPVHLPFMCLSRGVGADILLTVAGMASTSYLVEVSTDLVKWSPLGSVATTLDGVGELTDTGATEIFPRRFYRVVSP